MKKEQRCGIENRVKKGNNENPINRLYKISFLNMCFNQEKSNAIERVDNKVYNNLSNTKKELSVQ